VLHQVQADGTRARPARITLTDESWHHKVFDFTYSYDLQGNIVSEGGDAGVTAYTYDFLSRLQRVPVTPFRHCSHFHPCKLPFTIPYNGGTA